MEVKLVKKKKSKIKYVKPDETPKKKPKCKLSEKNGNMFNLAGIAVKSLKTVGQHKAAKEMVGKIFHTAKSYDEALRIIMEYVDVD